MPRTPFMTFTPQSRAAARMEFPSTSAAITSALFSRLRRFIIITFYACSGMHVKGYLNQCSLQCLLGHARMDLAMKKKMTPAQKAAQILSKLGAAKGGKARAARLSSERKTEIARKAAEAR